MPKRFLCPIHSYRLKTKPVILSKEKCSICRWEKRPWTLKDVAVELRNVADDMEFAHNDEYYDPHGITFLSSFEEVVKGFLKSIHPHYRKNFLNAIQDDSN